jgi:hypothetical protein
VWFSWLPLLLMLLLMPLGLALLGGLLHDSSWMADTQVFANKYVESLQVVEEHVL